MPHERAFRAAILMLCGCSLKAGDPRPDAESRPGEDTGKPSGPPALEVRPAAIDFGVVEVGGVASASLELVNVGGSDLVFSERRLADEEHTIEVDWAGGDGLAAGASVGVSLTWSPDVGWDDLESKLRIRSNDPVAPIVNVWLKGVTATPRIDVEPSSVDFGEVPIGKTIEQPIAIANVGYADLAIDSIAYMPSDPDTLGMEPIATPVVIPAGEHIEVLIWYSPEDDDTDMGVLTVHSDDSFRPVIHAEQVGRGVVSPDTGT